MEVAVNLAIYERLLDLSSISQRSWFMMSDGSNESIEEVNQNEIGSSADATSLLDLSYSDAASSPIEMPADISSYTALMESEGTLEPPASTSGYYPNAAMSGDLQDVVLASSRGKQPLLENEFNLEETAAAAQIEQFLQDLPSRSESIQLSGTKRSRETLDHGQLHEASSSETIMQPSTRKPKRGSSSAMAAVPLHEQNVLPQQQQRVPDVGEHVEEEAAEDEKSGLQLFGLLMESAECISADNTQGANSILPLVTHLSSPYGNPVQRVAAYFAEAIRSRILGACLGCGSESDGLLFQQSLFSSDRFTAAYQMFNEICPLVKFAHFTSNQAILEAFEGESRVHIIDLDIMQGLQWPALFQMLASRPSGAPASVRITALGSSRHMLAATGNRLSAFARSMGLGFEFVPVVDKIGNIADPRTLMVQDGENTAVAMHCMLHNLYDITGSDARALALIGRIRPKVVTVVEQEQQLAQDGDFLSRFMDALHYYSAVFDSLSSVLPAESEERHIVEQELLAREIRNIIGGDAGGAARRRAGGVKLRPWRRELERHGLEKWPLSGNAGNQASLLLGLFQACRGYTLQDEEGILKLGWKNSWLLSASAWGWPGQIHST